MIRGSQLLLIIRGQNQASGALRRVGADMARLGRYGDIAAKQQRVAIQQSNVMRQRQRALNELAAVSPGGKRYAAVQNARVRLTNEEANASRRLTTNLENQKLKTRELEMAQKRQASAFGTLGGVSRGKDPYVTAAARQRFQQASIQTTRYKNQLQGLQDQEKALRSTLGTMPAAYAQNTRAMATLGARANILQSELSTLAAREKLLIEQQVALERAMGRQRMWANLGLGGRILQHLGRAMQMFGLVATAGVGLAARAYAQFNTQVTLAATQTRKAGQSFVATAKNSEYLQTQILQLMKQFPASSEEMSKSAYDIYSSLDITLTDGVRLLKLFNKAAVAGQTDLSTVTAGSISVMNNFGFTVAQMPKVMERMFAAVRFGRMTFDEWAKSLSTTVPMAKQAGQSFDTLAGTVAFLSRRLDMRKTATGFARLVEILGRKKMVAGLKDAGVVITDTSGKLLQLPQIMDRILAKFPGLAKGGGILRTFFRDMSGTEGTVMARRAFVALATQLPLYHKMMGQVIGDNNEFTMSFDAMARTPGVKWGIFVNQLKALFVEMGRSIMPAIVRMIEPLRDAAKWFNNLSDSAKNSIGRWLAYVSVFALVGGTVISLLGSFIRLFAFLGSRGLLLSSFFATLAAGAVIIAAIKGDIHSLTDIVNALVDAITGHGFTGWAVGLTAVGFAAYKVAAAFKAVAVAQTAVMVTGGGAAVGGAAAGGGLIAGMIGGAKGFGRGIGATKGIIQANVAASGVLRGTLAGAAISAAMIPSALLTAIPIVAAVGGGIYLWKRHLDASREAAAKLKEEFNKLRVEGGAGRRYGDMFQLLVGSTDSIVRGKIQIREIKRTIADLRKELKTARGSERLRILDQITLQTLDLAAAQRTLEQNYAKSDKQFQALGAGFASFIPNANRMKALNAQLVELQKRRADVMKQLPSGVSTENSLVADIDRQIGMVRNKMNVLMIEMESSAKGLRSSFVRTLTEWARMDFIPKVSPKAMADLWNISKRLGRAVTKAEIKAIIKAEIDPTAAFSLPAAIRRIFSKVKAQRIKIEADTSVVNKATAAAKKAQKAVPKAFRFPAFTFPDPSANVKAVRKKAAKLLTPLHQKVIVDPPTNIAEVGAAIMNGIQGYLNAHPVTQPVIQGSIMNPITKAIGAQSPSKWAADKVGKPIIQGISVGLLENAGQLEKTAAIVANLFGGGVIDKVEQAMDTKKGKKKGLGITGAVLTKDLQAQVRQYAQFNNSLARLAKRGAPKELIDQLAELGPEAASKIATLSKMSAPQLRRYIALWKQAQREIKRSMRITQADIKSATKAMADSLVSSIQGLFDQYYEMNKSNFGELFGNLDPATYGEGLDQARKEYADQVNELQGQIADLNQQLVDLANEKRDQLAQAFGPLFSGEWLAGTEVQTKIDWGQKLGMDDLIKDLQGQLDKFQNWRNNLTGLAKKIPKEMLKALVALGPEAADKVAILNQATAPELAQYVALWTQSQKAIDDAAKATVFDTADLIKRTNDILTQIDAVLKKLAELEKPHELTGQELQDSIQKQIDEWMKYDDYLNQLLGMGLPAEFVQQLAEMGPKAIPILRALVSMNKDQLDKLVATWDKSHQLIEDSTITMLNRQLSLWFTYGSNIAIEIINGISSQSAALEDYFRQLIISLLEGKKIPPSPFTDKDKNTTTVGNPNYNPYINSPDNTNAGGDNSGYKPNTQVNMYVTAHKDESLATTLARAAFKMRTTVPG